MDGVTNTYIVMLQELIKWLKSWRYGQVSGNRQHERVNVFRCWWKVVRCSTPEQVPLPYFPYQKPTLTCLLQESPKCKIDIYLHYYMHIMSMNS